MGASPPGATAGGRRWIRRLLLVAVVATGAAALRERKLADNTRRFDLPG